ncbi:oxidoreductase [Mycolicibacterium sp. 018/SC-01/001]|uniref:aldo/keto reductase n=1 Tax=Mycolicibacterium sp. 018/SC-01/001 TaxID=2592069 RepID=UPI0011808269|nr:aldo/keto reductase [Mycolicibacterium sp. 018/SC-01/001]TRW89134.1 oxidoreductase [Mycolicibacterium sp. 018/SC-01/001]
MSESIVTVIGEHRIGFGAMQLAGPGVWGDPADVPGAIAVLRAALESGVQFFDTANAYGPRTVNRLIARALHPYPDSLIIGNKVGATRGQDGSWRIDSTPDTLRRQVHEALDDLRIDVSELTYLRLGGDGQAPPTDVPLEDALGTLLELRDEGLIRRIGLSGASPQQLRRAQQLTPVAAVQNRFNLLDRSGVEVLADCEAEDIAFVPYYPLASGLLDEDMVDVPARRLGVSRTQVALAWMLRRSAFLVPIPGTSSVDHVRENVAATTIADRLTADEVTALTMLSDESAAHLAQPHPSTTEALRGLADAFGSEKAP